jgi:hypothetical protein
MARQTQHKETAQSALLTMRVSPEFIRLIDDWRGTQINQITKPSRAAAIRYLTKCGIDFLMSDGQGRSLVVQLKGPPHRNRKKTK